MRIYVILPDMGTRFTAIELEAAQHGLARTMAVQFPQHEFLVSQGKDNGGVEEGMIAIQVAVDKRNSDFFWQEEARSVLEALRAVIGGSRQCH